MENMSNHLIRVIICILTCSSNMNKRHATIPLHHHFVHIIKIMTNRLVCTILFTWWNKSKQLLTWYKGSTLHIKKEWNCDCTVAFSPQNVACATFWGGKPLYNHNFALFWCAKWSPCFESIHICLDLFSRCEQNSGTLLFRGNIKDVNMR